MERKVSKATTKTSATKRKAPAEPVVKKTASKPKVTLAKRIDNAKKAVIVQFNNTKKRLYLLI